MFELWGKKRPINGYGQQFEWICNFDNEQNKYYMIDTLDREIYQEGMIIEGDRLVLYRELPKPNNKIRRLKNDKNNK